ncbi:MAG: cytochrome c [Arcicella sp.]|jgi:mono/diheme cytochrome c family protein|nr:cytochrome c [Arcicella sp.]
MTNNKIMFTNKTKSLFLSSVVVLSMASCGDKHNDPGTEFAANMYHSVGYEPLSQTEGDTNHINPYGMNMRLPVKGTVPRQYYEQAIKKDSIDGDLLQMDLVARNIKSGDMASSEALLTNPFEPTEANIEAGKLQYERYCIHCHGEAGKGDGAVAKIYKGVPVYSSDALKNLNDGHIYHTITHGKGRMWAHGSQISSADRWKIVLYVHQLQQAP